MKFIKSIFSPILNSFGRTIGRILAYILLALLLMLIFNNKVDAKSFTGVNTTLSTSYYDLFSGYIRNLDYNNNYVAFSYNCSTNYNNTCYALAYSNELMLENGIFTAPSVNLVKYDYIDNTRQLIIEEDTNFTFTGDIYYSNLGNSSSLEGGVSLYEKVIILALCFVFAYFIMHIIFKKY